MIKINIICIGKIKEKYFTDAITEYSKRLSAFCKFSIIELSEERIRSNTPNSAQINEVLQSEGKKILQKITPSDYVAAMCIEGKMLSSEELAGEIHAADNSGTPFTFIIGSSHGLAEQVKRTADIRLSFSKLTFPHQLFRVLLLEQLYRAYKINSGGAYHK